MVAKSGELVSFLGRNDCRFAGQVPGTLSWPVLFLDNFFLRIRNIHKISRNRLVFSDW
jgi:hypothetical protein